jgi:hypothetical protein
MFQLIDGNATSVLMSKRQSIDPAKDQTFSNSQSEASQCKNQHLDFRNCDFEILLRHSLTYTYNNIQKWLSH